MMLIALGTAAAGFGIYRVMRQRLQRLARSMFGVDSLTQGLELQRERLESTPKSVSSMTRVYLPQVMADFPEFSLPQFVQRAENLLRSTLLSIDCGRVDGLAEASQDYRRQLALHLENNASTGISEHFSKITIHQTELARYQKQKGCCSILLQSAVGHIHYKEREGALLSGSRDRLEQTKYELELLYIQDLDQAPQGASGRGLTCPNCGAPVRSLGEKCCEYCGAALSALNLRVWSFTRYSEVK